MRSLTMRIGRSRRLLAAACLACFPLAQAMAAAAALPAEQAGHAICGIAGNTVRDIGAGLYELAYSPRQNLLYAAVSGGFAEEAPPSRIAVLDPETLEEKAGILLPYKAFGLALDDESGRLYVGHSLHGRISVIDTARRRSVGEIVLSQPRPDGKRYRHDLRGLLLDPSARRLYAPGLAAGNSVLFVIGLDSLALEKTVHGLGFYPTGMALDDVRGRLFVSTMAGEILVLDTATLKVVRHWKHAGVEQPVSLSYDSGTDRLYVADQGMETIRKWQQRLLPDFTSRHPGNRVAVLDGGSGSLAASVDVGENPLAMWLDPGAQRLYLTERGGGHVAMLDARTLERLEDWSVDGLPNSLAVSPGQGALWISVKNPPGQDKLAEEKLAKICLTEF